MTQEHPITPPPELVKQWMDWKGIDIAPFHLAQAFAIQATRWGADQELEACCEWFIYTHPDDRNLGALRAARRPKPPSLKEQALQAMCRFMDSEGHDGLTPEEVSEDFCLIRRALEALPDD